MRPSVHRQQEKDIAAGKGRTMMHVKRFGAVVLFATGWFFVVSASGGRSARLDSRIQAEEGLIKQLPQSMARPSLVEEEEYSLRAGVSRKRKAAIPASPIRETFASSAGDELSGDNNSGQLVAEKWEQAMENLHSQNSENKDGVRMLIHEGSLTVEIRLSPGGLSKMANNVRGIVQEVTGYVEEESLFQFPNPYRDYAPEEEQPRDLKGIRMSLRVPSDQFHNTIKQIRQAVGDEDNGNRMVDWRTSSRDVTDGFVDATARANVVDASRQSLQVLMQKAGSVKDVFAIEKELTRLTEEYESHKQRANALSKAAALSTISIEMREKTSDPSRDQPFSRWDRFTPLESALQAVDEIIDFFAEITNLLAYLFVFIAPTAVLILLVVRVCCRHGPPGIVLKSFRSWNELWAQNQYSHMHGGETSAVSDHKA